MIMKRGEGKNEKRKLRRKKGKIKKDREKDPGT